MAAETAHVDDRIDAWLDRRLDEAERREVDRHLAACADCRGLRDALVAGRRALRSGLPDEPAPEGLEERIRAMLDREDAGRLAADARGRGEGDPAVAAASDSRPAQAPAPPAAASASAPAPSPPSAPTPAAVLRRGSRRALRTLLPIAAGLALAVLAGWWLTRPGAAGGPVDAAFDQLATLDGPALRAELRVTGAGALAERWERAGLAFPVRVIDLSAMGIELAGGDVTELAGAPAARAVYRAGSGATGDLIACWMFEGEEADLPAPAEVRRHRGFEFRVYRRGDATLVVWREGEVLCALAGRGDPEAVIRLAFGKAMAPGAGLAGRSPS